MSPFVAVLPSDVIALVGPDARRFCNSMFTNNARDLPVGSSQRTAMLDDRGRIVGLMDLYCEAEDRFLGVLDGMSADDFEARYALYVVLDDVEIARCPELAAGTVQGLAPPVPEGLLSLDRDRSGLGGTDVLGPRSTVAAFLAELGLPTADPSTQERARVRALSPAWPVDFGDKRLAHEMGMREAFLHFEKGCYVGQETVNRVDVMGQVKRMLAGLALDGPAPVGAELRLDDAAVGTLTSAVDDEELGRIGLAVLKRPHEVPGTELAAVWEGGRCRAIVRASAG